MSGDKAEEKDKRNPGTGTQLVGNFDPARIAQMVKEAYLGSAADCRATIDTLQNVIKSQAAENNALREIILAQLGKLHQTASDNIAEMVLRIQAEREAAEVREKHETLRFVAQSAMPLLPAIAGAAGPLMAPLGERLVTYLDTAMPAVGQEAAERAALSRLAKVLLDGGEVGTAALDALETMAPDGDWPLIMSALMKWSKR